MKNTQTKQYETKKNLQKIPLSLFLADHLLLDMGPTLKSG